MALDPSIPLSAKVFKPKSQLDAYGDAMTLKNLAGQQQVQDMQLQDMQQARSDKMRLKDLYRQAGGDPKKIMAAQMEVDPIAGMQAQSELSGQETENRSKELDLAIKRNQFAFQTLSGVRDQNGLNAARERIARQLGPDAIDDVPTVYNPDEIKGLLMQGMDYDKQLKYAMDEAAQTETGRHNLAMEGAANNKQTQTEMKLTNFLMPDGQKITVNSSDTAAMGQALEKGGIETGLAQPVKTLSPKEHQVAQQKIMSADILLKQISEVENKFKKLEGTVSAGPFGQGKLPTEVGKSFDAAVDNMRASVTGLQKVPGLGSMSDYETRLDQSKIPSRGNYESVTKEQIQYIKDYANAIKQGYSDMMNDSTVQPNNQQQPAAEPTVVDWNQLP